MLSQTYFRITNSFKWQKEEHITMQEVDRNRHKIIIARGTELFERLQGKINNLSERNLTLTGINLATLSILLTLLIFLRQMGLHISIVDMVLLFVFILFSVISLCITISLYSPTAYADLVIFKQERFDELLKFDEETLFEDFLYYIKNAYNFNNEKFKKRTFYFNIALYTFIVANITFILFVLKIIIWR